MAGEWTRLIMWYKREWEVVSGNGTTMDCSSSGRDFSTIIKIKGGLQVSLWILLMCFNYHIFVSGVVEDTSVEVIIKEEGCYECE